MSTKSIAARMFAVMLPASQEPQQTINQKMIAAFRETQNRVLELEGRIAALEIEVAAMNDLGRKEVEDMITKATT